ncbi:MAG TPA: hypothetical protein VEB18_03330 [Candidatus Paceibacterota bacterium]|nr:hypothetical protein [Candidatus Paceibacterota bacterium]
MGRLFAFLAMLGVFAPSLAFADTVCPELSPAQQLVGYVDGPGVLWFLGGVLILGGTGVLLSRLFALDWSKQMLGFIGLVLSGLLVAYGFLAPDWATNLFPGAVASFIGAVIFAPALLALLGDSDGPAWVYSAILLIVWGILAMTLTSVSIGFLAVLAFLHLLGFSAIGGGLSYAIGWDSEDKIPAATVASILLAGTFATLQVYNVSVPVLQVFESGAFWMGTLCAGVGMLIIASRWYGNDGKRSMHYALRQVFAIAVFGGGLYAGVMANEGTLLYIAAIFSLLYIVEKIYEISPKSAIAYGVITVGLGIGAVYGGSWLASNMDTVQTFITSMRA